MKITTLVTLLTFLAIPLLIAGYFYHLWSVDQQRWAAAREAAELRYAQAIESDCRLGKITDSTKCTKALSYLTAQVAVSN
ncbi:MAG TPA: hypothetical protein VFZ07_07345 [Dongiaceae bacterium]|jgi:hypothetical protein